MSIDEMEDVLVNDPAAAAAGITARDLMGMSLSAFEGRLSTVGVTQKITGSAKRLTFDATGMNAMGRMAERMYPMGRFSMNPFFQVQEWIEPWVFSAARGKKARLSGGWVDPLTGIKVEPTEVMQMQQQLIDRYAAGNPYAQFDQMERSLVFMYGSKAAKNAARKVDPRSGPGPALSKVENPHEREDRPERDVPALPRRPRTPSTPFTRRRGSNWRWNTGPRTWAPCRPLPDRKDVWATGRPGRPTADRGRQGPGHRGEGGYGRRSRDPRLRAT
jgi:hypothetical protein